MKVPISKGWLFKWENDKVTKPVIIWLILSLWENERKKVSVISTCICIHSWSILYEHRPDKQGVNFLVTNIQNHPNWTTRFFASKDKQREGQMKEK